MGNLIMSNINTKRKVKVLSSKTMKIGKMRMTDCKL